MIKIETCNKDIPTEVAGIMASVKFTKALLSAKEGEVIELKGGNEKMYFKKLAYTKEETKK